MKKFSVVVSLIVASAFLSGCATDPAKVPEFDATRLPPLRFEGLKPESVGMSVNVTRDANLQKGNSEAIKDVIRNAVVSSIDRGGTSVDPKSANQLQITVQNCKETKNHYECVAIRGELETPKFTVGVTSQGSHGLVREGGSAVPGVGNIDAAYEIALSGVLEGLVEQYQKFKSKK